MGSGKVGGWVPPENDLTGADFPNVCLSRFSTSYVEGMVQLDGLNMRLIPNFHLFSAVALSHCFNRVVN